MMTLSEFETRIEIKAERIMDRLDRAYLAAEMTKEEYNAEVAAIVRWAREQMAAYKAILIAGEEMYDNSQAEENFPEM